MKSTVFTVDSFRRLQGTQVVGLCIKKPTERKYTVAKEDGILTTREGNTQEFKKGDYILFDGEAVWMNQKEYFQKEYIVSAKARIEE